MHALAATATTEPAAPARAGGAMAHGSLFDSLTLAAAAACGVPLAFVVWVEDQTSTTIDDGPIELIDDAAARRYAAHGLATTHPIRFYAGVPITAPDGTRLGSLCVVDQQPKLLGSHTHRTLLHLAAVAAQLAGLHAARSEATTCATDLASRIALIQQSTPAMLQSIDPDGIILSASDTWLAELGYARNEVVGRPIFDFYTPESRDKSREIVMPALFASGRCDDIEYRMIRKDGSVIVVLLSSVVEYDRHGKPLCTMTVNQNITLRRQAEAALREEQERMARILEGTGAGTWELNIITGEARHNARWAEIAGYTLAEVGKTTAATRRALIHKDDLPKSLALTLAHYAGQVEYYELECRIRHKNGSWIWVLDRGRISARDATGRPLWMHGTRTDITARKQAEEALRASQNFLERVGQVAGVGGWEINYRSSKLTWSAETRRLFGVAADFEPTLEQALGFFAPEARPVLDLAVRQGMATGATFDLELPFVSATGRALWTRATGTVEFEDGKPLRMVGALQDVTRRKEMERDLAQSRELLQVTLESIADAVITTDNDNVVQWLNPVAERMTGWTKTAAVGRSLRDVFVIVDELTRSAINDPVTVCLQKAEAVSGAGHTTLISRSGSEFGIENSASPIRRADGQVHGAVLVFHDVSEQRRLNQEMNHRATHDPLTGLLNRCEFEARLGRMLAQIEDDEVCNALLYIDLDQFKLVNDACGHGAGDLLLKQVSGMLTRCVRGHDVLARLGGDEFGVILQHCDIKNAQKVAQTICDEMDAFRFAHDGRRFRVGASIGLVAVDQRWTSMKALLQAADASCYAAKDSGRNRVHAWFDSDQVLQARQGDMQWVSRIESALDEDRFELFGQCIEPIEGASTGLHFEVLLRLREANGNLVPPGAFLPTAERFHLATRIDRWVVRKAFEWMAAAANEHPDIEMMAINLSGQSLGDREFHRDVTQLVLGASFDIRKLCFEITETAAITHLADARCFIEGLRTLGVKIALDDFGAGASSFGYLKQLPVDFLKIDGHFIQHLLEDKLNNAAVRCFCDVARVVGVKTIAEFVEHSEVRDALREIGVDMAQGYLVHRPESLDTLLARVSSRAVAATV